MATPLDTIRTTVRYAWFPTLVTDGVAWLEPVRVTEQFSAPALRPELYGTELFWPEPPRWRRVRVERVH